MTRHYPDDASIGRLARGMIGRTLPKAEWTHAAHFASALWLLRHEPEPAERMPGLIRAYNQATGVENTDTAGYHETITQASLRAAAALLAAHPDHPLHEVVDALMDGPLGRSDWLLAHWSRERLFSVEARRGWLDPDLEPLPYP